MPKRQNSVSVNDLHLNSLLTDKIKRLALHHPAIDSLSTISSDITVNSFRNQDNNQTFNPQNDKNNNQSISTGDIHSLLQQKSLQNIDIQSSKDLLVKSSYSPRSSFEQSNNRESKAHFHNYRSSNRSLDTTSSADTVDCGLSQSSYPPTQQTTNTKPASGFKQTDNLSRLKKLKEMSAYVKTVLSTANELDFDSKYELGKEIGKGGFSCVYQCRDRNTGVVYAVKVIDLRPLRLRERFNPARLRREVDIMRRLRHPNIIQFIEVFETPENLMMVMEYAPGPELFDVILARKYFSEDDARPIFAQVAKALYYLHSMNIIHRDIKPENILILNEPDPATGLPIAKLLDFGLSKNAGAGSEAKTFVGTPCYLAPEVEYTSKGLGGTYGLAADCWSLGAVLYVMLVARFPEFEQDISGKIVVKLAPALWDGVSSEAKNLIRSLMNTNPAARLTAGKALQHPWLGKYSLSSQELSQLALSCYDMGQNLQEEERIAEAEYAKFDPAGGRNGTNITPSGIKVHDHAMVVRNYDDVTGRPMNSMDQVQLAPLLHLQRSIAACLDYAHMSYMEMPEVATQIRRGAVLCRLQVSESTHMLRKVEQTADAVLNLFPDLELAIEEGEPGLAADFFTVVKGWVGELRELVKNTQEANHASMMQIQAIVEQSTDSIRQSRVTVTRAQMQKQILHLLQTNQLRINPPAAENGGEGDADHLASHLENVTLNADQVMSLFLNLFGVAQNPQITNQAHVYSRPGDELTSRINSNTSDPDRPSETDGQSGPRPVSNLYETYHPLSLYDIDEAPFSSGAALSTMSTRGSHIDAMDTGALVAKAPSADDSTISAEPYVDPQSPAQSATNRLAEALQKLRHVDMILDQLGIFWAHTELVLDSLTKKGQHVEQFIGFSSKPRLMARFRERIEEYKRFWESISIMCTNYVNGVQQHQPFASAA